MWGHPGKKLLFMGQEFAQATEWDFAGELPWNLLDDARHAGVQRLVRDLNQLYRELPALHMLDAEAQGFEWLQNEDRDHSVLAWLRRDRSGGLCLVVCNFTPVPREGYRLPVPEGVTRWRERLNTDADCYGGSNSGNLAGRLEALDGHLTLTLPPLATLFLVPDEH